MSLDPAQRVGLERARAISIARDHFSIPDGAEVETAPFGVIVRDANRACIVTSSRDLAVLGGVLVWIDRNTPAVTSLVVEHNGGIHARRSRLLAPEIDLCGCAGGEVREARPAQLPDIEHIDADLAVFVALIERSGARAVVESGILRAEVAGLEVARVVVGEAGPRLEVGIGRFDREAGVLLHADRQIEPTLVEVIQRVARHRRPGASSDAVNRLCRERWIREVVCADPAMVGVDTVEFVEPIPPRLSLLERTPACLLLAGERRVLVACSVGADLGLVPALADLVARHAPDEIRVVSPARDQLPYLSRLAARLSAPVAFYPVDPPWDG